MRGARARPAAVPRQPPLCSWSRARALAASALAPALLTPPLARRPRGRPQPWSARTALPRMLRWLFPCAAGVRCWSDAPCYPAPGIQAHTGCSAWVRLCAPNCLRAVRVAAAAAAAPAWPSAGTCVCARKCVRVWLLTAPPGLLAAACAQVASKHRCVCVSRTLCVCVCVCACPPPPPGWVRRLRCDLRCGGGGRPAAPGAPRWTGPSLVGARARGF